MVKTLLSMHAFSFHLFYLRILLKIIILSEESDYNKNIIDTPIWKRRKKKKNLGGCVPEVAIGDDGVHGGGGDQATKMPSIDKTNRRFWLKLFFKTLLLLKYIQITLNKLKKKEIKCFGNCSSLLQN